MNEQSQPAQAVPSGGETFAGSQAIDPQIAQVIQKVLEASKQKPQLAQPVPAPISPGPGDTTPPQYMQQGPQWGFERFAHQMSGMIQNAWAQHKQTQLAKAESDWNQLQTAIQSGNQAALQSILGDPKKLKNMAKALNQDWMNPEKTDVYGQALQSHIRKQQAKGQAAQGLMGMFRNLIGRVRGQGQPQLTPEQQQKMSQEIMAKAPLGQPPENLKEILPLITEMMKESQRDKEAKEKEALEEKKGVEKEKLEQQKEDFTAQRDEVKAAHSESLERMREGSRASLERLRDAATERREAMREGAMFKALGIKEDVAAEKTQRSELNKNINGAISDLRKQYGEAQKNLSELRRQKQEYEKANPLFRRWTHTDPSLDAPEWQADQIQRAIDHIKSKQGSILKGTIDLQDVIDEAQKILYTPPPPSGFQPDK